MKNKRTVVIPFFFCLVFFANWVHAQKQHFEVGVAIGATNYVGDIGDSFDFSNSNIGGEVRFGMHYTHELTWRHSVGVFRTSAKDGNTGFEATGLQYHSVLEYYFFDYRTNSFEAFSPYIFGGLGLGYHTASLDVNGASVNSNPFSLLMPFGIGLKQRISTFWDLGFEFMAMHHFSDNIDASHELGIGANANPNLQGFEPFNERNDRTFFIGVTLTYQFWEIRCPRPSNRPQ